MTKKNLLISAQFLELQNKSIVTKIKDGINVSWIFFPGGPGLKSEYLVDLINMLNLRGRAFIFDFPEMIDDDTAYLEHIKSDIDQIIDENDQLILVGHSFAGMLLQLNTYCEKVKKVILLNSATTLDFIDESSKSLLKFSPTDLMKIQTTEAIYAEAKTDLNLKLMYKAWWPYYVTFECKSAYMDMIDRNHLDYQLHEWGNRFFFAHFDRHKITDDRYVFLNSENDKICPSSLISGQKNKYVLHCSSHFPWLEDISEMQSILYAIEGSP